MIGIAIGFDCGNRIGSGFVISTSEMGTSNDMSEWIGVWRTTPRVRVLPRTNATGTSWIIGRTRMFIAIEIEILVEMGIILHRSWRSRTRIIPDLI